MTITDGGVNRLAKRRCGSVAGSSAEAATGRREDMVQPKRHKPHNGSDELHDYLPNIGKLQRSRARKTRDTDELSKKERKFDQTAAAASINSAIKLDQNDNMSHQQYRRQPLCRHRVRRSRRLVDRYNQINHHLMNTFEPPAATRTPTSTATGQDSQCDLLLVPVCMQSRRRIKMLSKFLTDKLSLISQVLFMFFVILFALNMMAFRKYFEFSPSF